jgi:hypothetical protein
MLLCIPLHAGAHHQEGPVDSVHHTGTRCNRGLLVFVTPCTHTCNTCLVSAQEYGEAAAAEDLDLVDHMITVVDNERDPRCLLAAFGCMQVRQQTAVPWLQVASGSGLCCVVACTTLALHTLT